MAATQAAQTQEIEMNEAITILALASALALFIGMPIAEMIRSSNEDAQRKISDARQAARFADWNAKRLADRAAAAKSFEQFNTARVLRVTLRNRYSA